MATLKPCDGERLAAVTRLTELNTWRVGGGLLPPTYSNYARIFHPINDPSGQRPPISWRQFCNESGARMHALAQWPLIAAHLAPPHRWEGWEPETGISLTQLDTVLPILARATTTPAAVTFAIWTGYATLAERIKARDRSDFVNTSMREYVGWEGVIEAVETFYDGSFAPGYHDGPNMWWPHDQAWVVATEVDLHSTYIAGTSDLIEAVVAADGIEAYRVDSCDRFTIDSDALND